MRYLIPIVLLLGGCAGVSDMMKSKGTHDYTVNPDGSIAVKVDSVYGGPSLKVSTDKEGVRTITVVPAGRLQIEKLLEVLAP